MYGSRHITFARLVIATGASRSGAAKYWHWATAMLVQTVT
jgi:hypothetical protein